MDFFHTNYWSFHEGRFDEWRSIYPIFVFWLGRLFSGVSSPEMYSATALRVHDLGAISYLLAAYGLGAAACAWGLRLHFKNNGSYLRWRYIVAWFFLVLLSVPGLFAVERGNYILVAFMFLAMSAVSGFTWQAALFLALAINIKQYLVVLLFVPLVKQRYDFLLLAVVFAVIPNILGLIAVPEYHYDLLISNMMGFASSASTGFFEKVWCPTSLLAWLKGVQYSSIAHAMQGSYYEFVYIAMSCAVWAGRLLALAALSLAALRGRCLRASYLYFIVLLCLLVVSDAPGGYSLILLLPFVVSLFERPFARLFTFMVILTFMPMGYTVGPRHHVEYISFLSGKSISGFSILAAGAYLRPLVLVLFLGIVVADLYFIGINSKEKVEIYGSVNP
ncbi:MAG: hypothetical protein GXP59_10590 [Deltaproteobacteria bacterium]|nr:hypothetical protein [Deltaproteobacteria bacterium]